MYKPFYNLQRHPFELSPDPAFLYATPKHNEALAALYYGLQRRKGFVVLTGEVGTGKTLIVRCLLQLMGRRNIAYAYVFNPRLSAMEFLQYIAGDFHLATAGKNKSELLLDLSGFLIARHQSGLATVLVVDEAHHLSTEVLEEVRLLTNLETTQEKLLQIFLVGQPELEEILDSRDLRQLKQRIAMRPKLDAMHLEDTRGYIYRRLQMAGSADPAGIFPAETVVEIHKYSQGIPRLINTLCETALIHGYARQVRAIAPEVIEDIASDFRLEVAQPPRREQDHNAENKGTARDRNRNRAIEIKEKEQEQEQEQEKDTHMQRAARTLLKLGTYLQK
jgi:general secretion pathway protein A